MLTAMDEEEAQIRAFELQVDDYITKPFSLKLVLMRIEAVLRRIKEKSEKQKILSAQGIELNKDSHEVYKNGAPVNLTQLEFELLLTFLNHKNQVLTRDNLIQQVWGYDFAGDEKTVNIHIMNLRRKLDTGCIHTIRGVDINLRAKINDSLSAKVFLWIARFFNFMLVFLFMEVFCFSCRKVMWLYHQNISTRK